MGNLCGSCFKGTADASDLLTPDAETRRRQMAEAAERRQQEQSNRGIKNPESVKRMQNKSQETERLERERAMAGSGGQPNLKWTQG
ncbi:hypothetical protein PVAND_015101 [Polypedilum vanderplanki]|uniref:Small VCP/p97-interacting protein n=1 Tax=Polypedilum vanderplanki TaxID=319348 RepID=A0A9J6BBY8_POLVA|nr:hypothetical protein PVAND_015101 [Polypedilum vanderplanki]